MKVLIGSSTLDQKNGYGNITYELSRTLAAKGIKVTLLIPEDYTIALPEILGVQIEKVLPPYLFQAMRPKVLKYLTWRYKTDEKYDLVHSLFETPYAPLLARESKRMGVPFIVGAQGTYGVKPLTEQPERILLKYAYNTAKAIHVPSVYTRDAILKYAGEDYDITVIHNGVDFNRFNTNIGEQNPIRERYQNKKIILTVGQLKSRKGQDIVIRALPEVLKKHPETVYLIVGSDGWNGYLKKLADEIGVGEHVVCTGSVSYKEIIQYFQACDVYVHTPRVAGKYFFEGFGIVYLEAGACGKPAVGTDAGGIRDALLHDVTGFVADDEDVKGVSRYISELLGEPELRARFGNNAREYAQEHEWEVIADQYIDMYTSVLNRFVH